ncbi:hypothetical protein ACLB2K_018755 [Fragaria x ananassa]
MTPSPLASTWRKALLALKELQRDPSLRNAALSSSLETEGRCETSSRFFKGILDKPHVYGSSSSGLLVGSARKASADLSNRLEDTKRLAGNLLPPATRRLLSASCTPPLAWVGQPNQALAATATLSSDNVAKSLVGTVVYTVSNSNNEFVLISDPDEAKSIGLLCFRKEDAEAFLAQVRTRTRELRSPAKVVPITLDQVYMLKVEGIAFRFLPDPMMKQVVKETKEDYIVTRREGLNASTKMEVPIFLEGRIRKGIKIGMVNMEEDDVSEWKRFGKVIPVRFNRVSELFKWVDLFPEWIDEEEETDVPFCPEIPMPEYRNYDRMNLVVAKLPCKYPEEGWNRELFRLQVHLIAANLAVKRGVKDRNLKTKVVFWSKCMPMLEIFRCSDLVKQEGDWWLYEADMAKLKQKVSLPVGSCNLALPLWGQDKLHGILCQFCAASSFS